jgi:ATP-binding cassette subfamily F protein 3
VVVSHNRYFVSQVANKIWYIENEQIKEYPGTYEEYEFWKKKNEAGTPPPPSAKKVEAKVEKTSVSNANPNERKIKSLEQELKKIEEAINKSQTEKSAIETELSKPEVYADITKLAEAQKVFERVAAELENHNTKWEQVVLSMEELEK